MRTSFLLLALAGLVRADPLTVHVARFSGGGWSAARRARAALEDLDGVARVFAGGDRAVWVGDAPSREAVAAALAKQRMVLEELGSESRARPARAYVARLSGVGWARSAGRVREALVLVDGVQDAFVDRVAVVHATAPLEAATVRETLRPLGVTVEAFEEDPAQLWPEARRLRVAIVVYEGMELLDFAGPAEVLASPVVKPGFEVYTVGADGSPVTCQRVPSPLRPTYAAADCPAPDVLVIPGGATANLRPLLPWIEETVPRTRVTLTVCNAAVELARLGLLRGVEATSNRGCLDLLSREGAVAREGARWVDSGRIVTAAGVSAGIDGALRVVARTHGPEAAEATAAFLEYAAWDPAGGRVVGR